MARVVHMRPPSAASTASSAAPQARRTPSLLRCCWARAAEHRAEAMYARAGFGELPVQPEEVLDLYVWPENGLEELATLFRRAVEAKEGAGVLMGEERLSFALVVPDSAGVFRVRPFGACQGDDVTAAPGGGLTLEAMNFHPGDVLDVAIVPKNERT